ncbi:TetR/AcrR family transcriptional regulator [Georgenia sp.]
MTRTARTPTPRPAANRLRNAVDTKTRLLDAARQVVCDVGLAGASARTIAARAGANQALIFYHFHTVSELIEAASNRAVDEAVGHYREAFAEASTLDSLLDIGRELHDRERDIGNVTFMAQILSGAPHDPVLARAARYAMSTWTGEVHIALDRVLGGAVVGGLVDLNGLAHLVSAGFIGLELYGAADPPAAAAALSTVDALGHLVDRPNTLGPVAHRALKTATRHRL